MSLPVNEAPPKIPAGSLRLGQWPKTEGSLSEMRQSWADKVCQLAAPHEQLAFLDAGSGNGMNSFAFAKYFLQQGHPLRLVLVDRQNEGVVKSQELFDQKLPHLNLDARVADISTFSYPTPFHGVICLSVLPWLETPATVTTAVHNFYRLLVPNGLVIASATTPFNLVGLYAPNPRSSHPEILRQRTIIESQVYSSGNGETDNLFTVYSQFYNRNIHLMTLAALSRLFREAGFNILSERYIRNSVHSNTFPEKKYAENCEVVAQKI